MVAFSNNPYSDAVGMGYVLRRLRRYRGVVVGLNFVWFGPPFGLDGRWITGPVYSVQHGTDELQHQLLGHLRYDPPLIHGHFRWFAGAFFPANSIFEPRGCVGSDVSRQ